MDFAFTEEQHALRRTLRQFLASCSSPERVRAAMATEAGYDLETWRRLGTELGLTALIIPEAYGGAGLGLVELVAVMEEMGRTLFCAPFLSTVGLAVNAIAMPLIGGTGSWLGPVVGAVLVGGLQEYLRVTISSAVNVLVAGVLMVAFVIAAPQGIVGLFQRKR